MPQHEQLLFRTYNELKELKTHSEINLEITQNELEVDDRNRRLQALETRQSPGKAHPQVTTGGQKVLGQKVGVCQCWNLDARFLRF